MAATFSCTVSGTITSLTEGSNTVSFSYTNSTAPGYRIMVRAATTAVGIKASLPPVGAGTWPTGSSYVIVVPGLQASSPTKLFLSASSTAANGAAVDIDQPFILPLGLGTSSPDIFLGTDAGTIDCEVYVV